MTAIVKHISVHPNFRYARRVGIFDELDKRDAELKRQPKAKRQAYKQNAFCFNYVGETSKVNSPLESPFTPSPEK